jgi:hypothetical protein
MYRPIIVASEDQPVLVAPALMLIDINQSSKTNLAFEDFDSFGFASCVFAASTIIGRYLDSVRHDATPLMSAG